MSRQLTPEERSSISLTNIADKDCGVIALQAVTGWRRGTAEAKLGAAGFTHDGGTPRGSLEKVLTAAGWQVQRVPFERNDTGATFSLMHEWGTYLLYTERHVMALLDGDLHNARGHWGKRLELAVQLTR